MYKATKKIPAAPTGFQAAKFFEGIYWHQRWQIFKGVFTPGINSIEQMCKDLHLPDDLSGKRVLDIGAWNGCLSFECERRGAREVVALSPETPEQTGFHRIREMIGSKRTHYLIGSVYDLNPEKIGYFDIVLFCGVLYHLRYPLLGIDNIRRVCTGEVFVETVVSDAQLMMRKGAALKKVPMENLSRTLLSIPLWQFYRHSELNEDPSNWFGPNAVAVAEAMESAGFATTIWKNFGRATFQGKVKEGVPEFLTIGTGEGAFYEPVVVHLFGKERLGFADESRQFLTAILGSEEYLQKKGNTNSSWLANVYADLLGRQPHQTERADVLKRLSDGFAGQRQTLVRGVMATDEYRWRLIAGYFKKVLGRSPSEAETQGWLTVMQRGASGEDVFAGFLGSEEYYLRHGGNNCQWLHQVYLETLGREMDSESGKVLQTLDRGLVTREQIAAELIDRPEYKKRLHQAACATEIQSCIDGQPLPIKVLASAEFFEASDNSCEGWLIRLFKITLGRPPEAAELDLAVVQLREANAIQRQACAAALVGSMEYCAGKVTGYFTKLLGRPGSNADIRHWAGVMQRGTQAQVLAGFLASDEYFQRCGGTPIKWLNHACMEALGRKWSESEGSPGHLAGGPPPTREQIAVRITTGPEHLQRMIRTFYEDYLQRSASEEEMKHWTLALRACSDEPKHQAA